MGIGTFGSFTQARLGIYAAQNGLSVTGNNIANINTTGYTRQKLDQTSFYAGGSDRYYSTYDMRIGNGVLCKSVSQLRDPYLDIRYRGEMSSVGAMDAKLAGLENIQRVLDEVGDGDDAFGILGAQFSDFFNQLQQLSDQTGLSEYDIQVRSSAESLVKQFNSYAAQLKEIEKNAEIAFGQDVDVVNNILTSIRDLNASIRKADIHGDNALELRDERNLLIDKLSSYMKIDVTYTEEDIGGVKIEKLNIKLGNANPDPTQEKDETVLVDGTYARQLVVKHPRLNDKYDDTKPLGGDNLPYLNKAGKPVETEQEAVWDYNENYAVELAPLKDSKDRVLVTTTKDSVNTTTLYPGKASESTTDPNTGITTIITYAKTGKTSAKENPNWDGINPDAKYLKADGTTTGDMAQAEQVDSYIKTVYTKAPSADVELHDNDLYGSLQSQREMLTEKGEFTSQKTIDNVDPNAATKRGIPYYRNALNLLANQFATVFNNANQGFVYNEKGNYVNENGEELKVGGQPISKDGFTPEQIAKLEAGNFGTKNADGTFTVMEMKEYLAIAGGKEKGCPLFSNRGDGNNTDGITAENISISLDWQNGPKVTTSFMEYSNPDVSNTTDSSNILHMLNLMGQKMDYDPRAIFDPNDPDNLPASDSMFKGDFNEMWVNIGSVLGNDMSSTNTMLDTYYASSVELDTGRNSVSGVDLNDEAMNLMQYSKSYNAACRLMTTLDSVLDKLINGTGMTT